MLRSINLKADFYKANKFLQTNTHDMSTCTRLKGHRTHKTRAKAEMAGTKLDVRLLGHLNRSIKHEVKDALGIKRKYLQESNYC